MTFKGEAAGACKLMALGNMSFHMQRLPPIDTAAKFPDNFTLP
jgi:hypothetical protein